MKYLILHLFLSESFLAQGQNFTGNYDQTTTYNDGSKIDYTLKIKADGTFDFHFYRKLICKTCEEENQYGRGSWKQDG